jgi:rhomboid protease GluP
MAFGLSPKHIQNLPLDNLTTEQFLAIAINAAMQLNWNIRYASKTGFTAFTKSSMSSTVEEVKVKIDNGNAFLKSECHGSQISDWGKNKENIENLVTTINELKSAYTSEELERQYERLKPNFISKEEEDILSQPSSSTKEKLNSIYAMFKPTQGYFITPIIINLNIAIFILMVVSGADFFLPDNASLLKWGANFRPLTLDGEWWRLITNCFLHIGVFNFLMNMYALLYIGLLLEPHLGKARFLSAYLLTGLAASIASLWWHDMTISAGASGAIFGMYGVFLAMLTTNLIEKSARKELLTSIVIFVGYNLLNGFKGGIDNAAHIGGLVSGLGIGYAFIPGLKKHEALKLKYATIGILIVLIISTSFIVYKIIPNDIVQYDAKIKEFASMESLAMEVFKLPPSTPKDKLLYGLKDRGIYYWNENIKLLNELDKLNLPSDLHNKNKQLINYCDLRIKCYTLLYKTLDEDTDKYKDSIDVYTKQIELVITELGGEQQTK